MRDAVAADAPALAALHAAAFTQPWSRDAFEAFLAEPGMRALVAEAGLILWRTVMDEAEILTLAVAPAQRRRGIARRLLDRALELAATDGARTMFLEVSSANDAAVALYRSAGFEITGHRRGYYQSFDPPQDALNMRLALTGASAPPISGS
jgi:[ribosomal protein S18]-alanine N-acetyltransferase